MAPPVHLSPELQALLQSALPHEDRASLRSSVLPALLGALSEIAHALRTSPRITLAGSANTFGDDQLNVDVSAENAIRLALTHCPSVVTASSEEDPVEKSVASLSSSSSSSEVYTVAFDPLDGSSIIAPNWTVGTILGVWDGISALHQPPSQKQIAAVLGVLGPRATAIVALRTDPSQPRCFELGLGGDGFSTWELVRDDVRLATPPFKTRYFAPANLRAAAESPQYMEFVSRSISDKYTLRYSGGLVPDLVHALVKGHGVYVSPVTSASRAKLRKLYELFPVALIMECAGGAAVDPQHGTRILDGQLQDTDERGGLLCGNVVEVERAMGMLNGK